TLGLVEDDARFGTVFEALTGITGQPRPTLGLLNEWWPGSSWRCLQRSGLVQIINSEAPRSQWALQLPVLLWEVLRGDTPEQLASRAHFQPSACLPGYADLILPDSLLEQLQLLPALLEAGEVKTLIARGFQHNGRRTMLKALARQRGLGFLELAGL